MGDKQKAVLLTGTLALLANAAAFAQPPADPRTKSSTLSPAPTVTILPAPSGALLRSHGIGNASLDLGHVSYFSGVSAPGQSAHKHHGSLVISTRFALKVDCPGNSASSKVSLTMSRMDASPTHAIAIDGTTIGPSAQVLEPFMPCGSAGEHRMEVDVPVSTPAGSIGSTVVFVATLIR